MKSFAEAIDLIENKINERRNFTAVRNDSNSLRLFVYGYIDCLYDCGKIDSTTRGQLIREFVL